MTFGPLQILALAFPSTDKLEGRIAAELTKLSDQLQCLLAAEGFTAEPIGGCPVGDGVDAEQVSRIVETVVSELKKRGMA